MPDHCKLVCFALKEEAAPFQKIVAGKPGLSVLIVGIGRQNAGKSVRKYLADNSPHLVLTCGFAGGLNPELKLGDVVFDSASCNSQLAAGLLNVGAKSAKFLCADRIAITVAEKKELRAKTGADVVEMESAVIQAVCADREIPCATVRVISDTASEDLPLDFNALSKPDKNLDFGKLAWVIAKSPAKIGALMELQRKTKLAAKRLAAVLEQIVFSRPS